ncbi:unnamed protein product, partial [Musa acuminata subsp. burmannicoides]
SAHPLDITVLGLLRPLTADPSAPDPWTTSTLIVSGVTFLAAEAAVLLLVSVATPIAFEPVKQIHRIQSNQLRLLFDAQSTRSNLVLLVHKFMVVDFDGAFPDRYAFPVLFSLCRMLVHVRTVRGEYIEAGLLFDEMLIRDVVSWVGWSRGI